MGWAARTSHLRETGTCPNCQTLWNGHDAEALEDCRKSIKALINHHEPLSSTLIWDSEQGPAKRTGTTVRGKALRKAAKRIIQLQRKRAVNHGLHPPVVNPE